MRGELVHVETPDVGMSPAESLMFAVVLVAVVSVVVIILKILVIRVI